MLEKLFSLKHKHQAEVSVNELMARKARLFDAVFLDSRDYELWCKMWRRDKDGGVKSFVLSIAYGPDACTWKADKWMIYTRRSLNCNTRVDHVTASIESLAEMPKFALEDWFLMKRLSSNVQAAMKSVFLDECLRLTGKGRSVEVAKVAAHECMMKPWTTLESLEIEQDLLDGAMSCLRQMRSKCNLSSVNVHKQLKKKDMQVETAMLEQKLTRTKVLHEVARHLRCIVVKEPPLAEGGGSVWHLEDASTHEEMRCLVGSYVRMLHGFTKLHLLDELLGIAEKLVACSLHHLRENPFFGCKSLEEVMMRCDLLDAVEMKHGR